MAPQPLSLGIGTHWHQSGGLESISSCWALRTRGHGRVAPCTGASPSTPPPPLRPCGRGTRRASDASAGPAAPWQRRFPMTCPDTALMAIPNAGSERLCAVPGTDSGDQDPRAGTFLADTSAARQSARRRRHTIATSRPGRVRCPRFLTRSVRTATPPHLSFDYRLKTSAPLRCRAGRATSTPAGDGRPGPLKPRAPSRCESISGTLLWACIYILTSTSSLSLLAPPARRRRRDVVPPRASARKSIIVDDTGWNNESAT